MLEFKITVKTYTCSLFCFENSRAGSIREKTDTIHIAIRIKQYAIRIDDTIQR